jgi:hypothetical protein
MSVVEKTLQENYIYFIKELARIHEGIKELPAGNISAKKIGKSTYYYQQWREGRKVKSVSLGGAVPSELLEAINKRQLLEKQKKEVLSNIRVIAKAINTQKVTAEEIIKIFSRNGIKAILIGSYCMPVMQDELGFSLPTIKTQDIDFLLDIPYKGKEADVESMLKTMGFSIGFAPDGSTYFTNGIFKVEFLTPEKGKGSDKAVPIHALKIRATPLRYLQMLAEQPLKLEREDYVFFVPNPWTLAFHKILISQKRKTKDKKEKDLLQAVSLLRGIRKDPDMLKKTLSYLDTLPGKWEKQIKSTMNEYFPDLFITLKQR